MNNSTTLSVCRSARCVDQLAATQAQLAQKEQEARAFALVHEQTLSTHIIVIHLEELQECNTSRDAHQKEVGELRGKYQQLQRIY